MKKEKDKKIHHFGYEICGLAKKDLTSCGRRVDNSNCSCDKEKITCHLCINILNVRNEDYDIK